MATESFSGHTVAITGGAGGLGKAIATAFLSKAYPGKFLASKTDITDEAAVEDFIADITTKFGHLDMVINNAGIIDKFDPVGTTSKETWDRVMGINLTGMFLVSKTAVNAMEKQSPIGGTTINIGSVANYRGANGGFAYTVSKHGVVGITKNIAGYYMDKGINSIALLIGGMDDTNLSDNFLAGINQEGMMRIGSANPGYTSGKTNVQLADVAKYCVFPADRDITASSNGGTITFNKNWPVA